MQQVAQNKEFIDEEIIKIICDALKSTFELKVKFESSDSNLVEVILESEREREVYNNIFYREDKVQLWCNQLIDQCIKGLIKLDKMYKYVVTCVMVQNVNKPFCTMGCGYFEEMDGAVSKAIAINDFYFCLSIYGLAI